MSAPEPCPLCGAGTLQPLREVSGVPYLRCDGCGSILAERAFLERTMAGEARAYDNDYWSDELKAARERGYGASLIRLAEVFFHARRPVRRFLDVSCGAGTLLDAAAELMPEIAGTFWGIEPFPPPPAFRARHPNYRVGFLRDLEGRFDGGTCIEVIEHLPPPILRSMVADLAAISEPDALWYFNSAQPDFVLQDDPGYLDPYERGHIASYSVQGLRPVFAEAGFTLHALPGRDWAFLAEYARRTPEDTNALMDRLWGIHPDNRSLLASARFGEFLLAAGLEGARCYLEAATARWAVGEMLAQAPRLTAALNRQKTLEAEIAAAFDRQKTLEAEIAAVRASTSWRVTMPLRHAMRMARRLLGRNPAGRPSSPHRSNAVRKTGEQGMAQPKDGYARRLEKEIAVFEGQEKLHQHAEAFHHYGKTFAAPLLQAAFGRQDLYEIYAESIAGAVERTGLPTVFSLGCGDGEQERAVIAAADRMGLPRFAIIGIEVAPAVADRANALTAAAGMSDRLKVVTHDLNTGLPGTEDVAAVMAHHVLHHIVDLEGLFDFVAARLHAEGAVVTFDMIGRNGHMRWPEVRPLMRRIWAALPPSKRVDHQLGGVPAFFREWDCAVEGFEGVRAQDILGLMDERFRVSRFAAWGGVADIFLSPRFGRNFDLALSEDRAFVEEIGALERRLLDARRTTPASMAAEFRSRRSRAVPAPQAEAALARALRKPGEIFESLDDEPFLSPYPPQPAPPCPTLEAGREHVAGAGLPLAAALQGGWESPDADGSWALLDEQFLRFRTSRPVDEVTLGIWSNLPTARRQAVSAEAEGCAAVSTGDLPHGASALLRLRADRPRDDWTIRLTAHAYRLPDLDGGDDRRPLAYRLARVRPGAKEPDANAPKPPGIPGRLWKAVFGGR